MRAIILLGGIGSRLRPFTLSTPKPLLPVLNRPFFAYQLDQLKKHGVKEVVLALGYRAAYFRRHLGDGRRWGMRFVYSLETTPLGTGGAMRKAWNNASGPSFIFNGDILSDLDLGNLYRHHRQKKAQATLALKAVPDPSLYGLIESDPNGKIRRFVEKPTSNETTSNTINAGYYIFEPEIFQQIPEDQPVSIERDIFPRLVKSGFSLYGFLHKGYWIDIGTLRSYWQIHMDLISGDNFPKAFSLRRVRKGIWAGPGCRVAEDVRSRGTTVLGEACKVGPRVIFQGNVCVGPRCVIGESVRLSDCVLHAATRIEAHSHVQNSLIGSRCRIGSHSEIGPYATLADGSSLGPHTQLAQGHWDENRA